MIEKMYQTGKNEEAEQVQQAAAEAINGVIGQKGIAGQLSRGCFGVLVSYHEKEEAGTAMIRLRQAVTGIRTAGGRPVTLTCQAQVLYCDMLSLPDESILEHLLMTVSRQKRTELPVGAAVAENRIRSIMEDSLIGTYIVKPDRTIVYWNKAAEKITGYSGDWMTGRRCSETLLNHVDDAGNHLCKGMCPFLTVLETEKPAEKPVFLHKRDGSLLRVNAVFTPIRDENGTIVEVMEQFYPIEDRK